MKPFVRVETLQKVAYLLSSSKGGMVLPEICAYFPPNFGVPEAEVSAAVTKGVAGGIFTKQSGRIAITAEAICSPYNAAAGLYPHAVNFDAVGDLGEPIIDGYLRRGEVGSLISSPKVSGKSAAIHYLLCAATCGCDWFGREVKIERALLVDNEIPDTGIKFRLSESAKPHGTTFDELRKVVDVWALRGRLQHLGELTPNLLAFEPRKYGLIVIDSLYRIFPPGTDENDNHQIACVFNTLDKIAKHLDCAILAVHHTSKGSQRGKAVSDMGAGAGAASRAGDAHIVMRPHREPSAFTLEAICRSFPPIPPTSWRYSFPTFTAAPDLDGGEDRPTRTRAAKPSAMNAKEFVTRFCQADPQELAGVQAKARQGGLSTKASGQLVKEAIALELLHEHPATPRPGQRGAPPKRYSTEPPIN